MEPFPYIRNVEFVPKSIIMQEKYYGIADIKNEKAFWFVLEDSYTY